MPPAGPGRPRRASGPPPADDLVSLAFDDAVLDRLAARTRRPSPRSGLHRACDVPGDRVSDLFAQWQDRLTARPEPVALDAERAAGLVASAPRRSALRPALAIAAAICALLVGSAAIGARTAQPGDPLFPVTQVLWTQQADSAVAGQQIRVIIGVARDEVVAGRLAHAAELLRQATRELGRVTSGQAHAEVQGDLLAVWALLTRATTASGQDLAAGNPLVTQAPTRRAARSESAGAGTVAPASGSAQVDSVARSGATAPGDGRTGVGIAGTTTDLAASSTAAASSVAHSAVGSAASVSPGTSAGASAPVAAPSTSAQRPPAVTTASSGPPTTVPTTGPTAGSTTGPATTTTPTAPTPPAAPSTAATASTTPSPTSPAALTQVPVTPSPTTPTDPTATTTSSQAAMTGQAMIMPAPGPPPVTPTQAAPTTGTTGPGGSSTPVPPASG